MRDISRNKFQRKPSHVEVDVWNGWQAKWNSEEFKAKSVQNKINRRNGNPEGPALPTHNSGSACHLKVASLLVSCLLYFTISFEKLYLWFYICNAINAEEEVGRGAIPL